MQKNNWLLTWNPLKWSWDDSLNGKDELRRDISQVGYAYCKWTCGVNKSIKKGDRIFMIRLGYEPRGIMASGYAASDVFEGTHWDNEKRDNGKLARRIFVSFDCIEDRFISYEKLLQVSSKFKWSTQASGISIAENISEQLELIWSRNTL